MQYQGAREFGEKRIGWRKPNMATRKTGRDARNGQFIPVREAERRKSTAIVETIRVPTKPRPKRPSK